MFPEALTELRQQWRPYWAWWPVFLWLDWCYTQRIKTWCSKGKGKVPWKNRDFIRKLPWKSWGNRKKSLEKVGKFKKSPLKKLKVAFLWAHFMDFQYVDEHIFWKRMCFFRCIRKSPETVENIMKQLKQYWLRLNIIYNKIYKLQLLFTYNTLERRETLIYGK